jgi:L-serine dehydratase
VKPRVDLDTCISAMAMTARDMHAKYKETSEAGLAAFVLC